MVCPVLEFKKKKQTSAKVFFTTNTRHIYYDVRISYKDAYRYIHIHKGYRGTTASTKSYKGPQKTRKLQADP
jgi:hypothetical protein